MNGETPVSASPRWDQARACLAAAQHQEPVQVCECVGAGERLDRCGDEQGTRTGTQEGSFKDKTLGWGTTAAQGNCSQLCGWNKSVPGPEMGNQVRLLVLCELV